jgi:hypothetical protein
MRVTGLRGAAAEVVLISLGLQETGARFTQLLGPVRATTRDGVAAQTELADLPKALHPNRTIGDRNSNGCGDSPSNNAAARATT